MQSFDVFDSPPHKRSKRKHKVMQASAAPPPTVTAEKKAQGNAVI